MVTTTAIIRQRGQLTLPKIICKKLPWIKTGAVVQLRIEEADKIIIEPYRIPNR